MSWSEPADLAVLSLLGPRLADTPVLEALGMSSLPAESTAVALARRRIRAPDARPGIELDLVVPREQAADWRQRLVDAGVRPAGVWAYEAHRVAALRPRLGVDTDERTIPHEVGWIDTAVHLDKGCYRGQETVARVHNLGKPPRMLVLLHLDGSADRPATGDPVLAGGRAVGRLGTVVDHVDEGPIALALLKRGIPADTELTTGGETQVAAVIDAESMPAAARRVRGGWRWTGYGATRAVRGASDGPASAAQRGTVKCWQDNKTHTDRSRLLLGPLRYCARGSPHGPRPGEGKADQGCT